MRIKELRTSRHLSQLKMAMDLNMAQNTLSRYETGEREPGISELIRIADYFQVSVDYLIGHSDHPDPR
ncbi:MAG: helix-turn-helix transcriptional regulator [Clostridia bacterium]|nr:helix-turn-helix transcriptional regulator [Clostridia bacterium]